ncbi:MAG TPA: glycosyltransferase family 4 protein [Bacteroidales bacterium]|nr:glycosyltransferase family 4 protein [Bacteroidales bacterium]
MNILMLLENDYLSDFRVQKEVRSLREAGHKLTVAAVTSGEAPYITERDECLLFTKKIPSFIRKASVGALKFPFYFSFWYSYVNDILKNHKADVVHIHDLPLARVGKGLRERYGARFVLDLHENWPDFLEVSQHTKSLAGRLLSSTAQWRKYEKESVRQADHVITVVTEMKDRLVQNGAPAAKIIILENTPPVSSVTNGNTGAYDIFNLVYVGGITQHRGLQYVIRGLALLKKELTWHFTVAGDGRYLPELKALTVMLGIADRVSFAGKITKQEAENLISRSDLAVLPHVRSVQSDNSSPNKLFEYMAAGIPVLASNCISIKRVIDETNSGVTYVDDSPENLALKLRELYLDRENLRHMGENGRKAVMKYYNWENTAVSLIQMYSSLSVADNEISI